MSHNIGRIVEVEPGPLGIGPTFGDSSVEFEPEAAPAPGTRFLLLHFRGADFPAANRLEVELGYGTDVFGAADGPEFWTRPIDVAAFPGGRAPIRCVVDGASSGGVQLDVYGRAQRLGEGDRPETYTNCDLFLQDPLYVEPTYDPFWICNDPPNWQNYECLPSGGLRRKTGRSACMVVSRHGEYLSTCSATLISPDLVLTAGHCFSESPTPSPLDSDSAGSASVVFGYQVTCMDGAPPDPYEPQIIKVVDVVEFGYDGGKDYIVLRLKTAPSGIPALPMRTDLPDINEEVFAVHHPNGAVKKVSPQDVAYSRVTDKSSSRIRAPFDVAGGSSGSGLYDKFGNVIGVLSNGRCGLTYYPTATILKDIASEPPPPDVPRDVMITLDRSGSMAGATVSAASKIEAARDAASLFVTMVREGEGHKVGLVSFSSEAEKNFDLQDLTAARVEALVGEAPYSGGIVGDLEADGSTTIGGGLQVAAAEFSGAPGRDEVILLLTDGMENTPPMIEEVEPELGGKRLCIVGYGDETNLDGPRLTRLAIMQDGSYTVAPNDLVLKKFFASCFGDIFASGFLMDPDFFLPAEDERLEPFSFTICGEDEVTIVLGWDDRSTSLSMDVRTPDGDRVSTGDAGVTARAGHTWRFVRIELPHAGERDGTWTVEVFRPDGGEFPPPRVDLRGFVNIVAHGGPSLERLPLPGRLYTGDVVNPLVRLAFPTGTTPPDAQVQVTVRRPGQSLGNILTDSGLRGPMIADGDTFPARQAMLALLAAESAGPLVTYEEETYELFDDGAHEDGAMESDGIFGNPLEDILRTEGTYTFRARATYGRECEATREVVWSVHAVTRVDEETTTVETIPAGITVDGRQRFRVKITPRDGYGNYVGPGVGDTLDLSGTVGTTVVGPLLDNGDGSYETDIEYNPRATAPPGVVINQPDRPPAVFSDPGGRRKRERKKLWGIILALLLQLLALLLLFWRLLEREKARGQRR